MDSRQIIDKFVNNSIQECRAEYGANYWPAVVSDLRSELSIIMTSLNIYAPDAYEMVVKNLRK